MTSLIQFSLIYLLGGLTLLPLAIVVILCHAYVWLPVAYTNELCDANSGEINKTHDSHDDAKERPETCSEPARSNMLIAGYFTVLREFIPGGFNSRPSDRVTSAGTVIHTESLNVYQSMYRSIFDRGKSQTALLDGHNAFGKTLKRMKNAYYIVLRCVIRLLEQYVLSLTCKDMAI